jgi:hypothetical protein
MKIEDNRFSWLSHFKITGTDFRESSLLSYQLFSQVKKKLLLTSVMLSQIELVIDIMQ